MSVRAFIRTSRLGEAMPWRKGVAHVSSANTSCVRTPSATTPSTTRLAIRPAKPTTTVIVARAAGGRTSGADMAGLTAATRARGPPPVAGPASLFGPASLTGEPSPGGRRGMARQPRSVARRLAILGMNGRLVGPGTRSRQPCVQAQGADAAQRAREDIARVVRIEGHTGEPHEHDPDAVSYTHLRAHETRH